MLGEQSLGQVLLIAVGLGFVAHGVFQVVRARYAADCPPRTDPPQRGRTMVDDRPRDPGPRDR